MDIVEILSHPLSLLLIGAVISGLLIPFFTNRWQIHQKGLEIRIDLVGRISQTVMGMMTMIESIASTKPFSGSNKEYRKFKVDSAVIGTELESYFPKEYFKGEPVGKEWSNLVKEIESLYEQTENNSIPVQPAGVMGKTPIDTNQMDKILAKKGEIIQFVLNKPMPRFSLLPGFIIRSPLYMTLTKHDLIDAGHTPKDNLQHKAITLQK